ncbi:2'-5' RNA ligase [Candidatus Daviesbacteria bacterium RIFCSPLOWO2_02_FULL_36_7]|uniref:2'-5' RNA ligase n=1 Tax=Candidatus Daviesbacteria bacterium RIFCSPLOWO2_02_FULL_36_7 TaxID=1797792 RepID=A0A1F5MG49_9BACT|nr:MAG: 2'-5' RNA ligase [Candidatus Daviesbacteria bacterium RIFCSPLOWO2_02_FULL_36_7]
MISYTSYFIGIPMPEKYQQGFEDLQADVSQISPLFKTTHPKTPHITAYYLDKQTQSALPEIAESVKKYLEILNGVKLKVGGFGYFRGDDPKVLFLDVDYPEAFNEFNKIISKSLSVYYSSDKDLPFHPHITVAWVGDPKSQKAFKLYQSDLKSLLDKINWSFKITEVVLYGVDSTKKPEYLEKLITLALV